MGPVHHGLVTLLAARPAWVVEVLVRHRLIPAGLEIIRLRTEAGFRRAGGRYGEGRTDLTFLLRPPGVDLPTRAWRSFHRLGAIGVLVEVQRFFDEDRLDTWETLPLSLRRELGRHQCLVLVTLDENLGAQLREELDNLSLAMRIFVLTPSKVPRIERPDPNQVEQTLLNAMFHVRVPTDLPLLDAAMDVLESIDGEDEMIYREMLFSHLQEIESMSSVIHKYEEMERRWPGYEPTESELNSYLYVRGHRFGRHEGRLLGRAQAVLDLLRLRGLAPSPELEAIVLACQDDVQIQIWLGRAMAVERPEQLLDA